MTSINLNFFKNLVETTGDLVTRIDHKGRLRYVSPSIEHVFGVKSSLCIGRKALSFVDRIDRRNSLEAFVGWIANRSRNASIENRIVSIKGETRHIIWAIHLDFDNRNALLGINTIGRDITKLKTVEKQLRRREEMWNTLFMSSPTWIILATLEEGKFLDFNHAFCDDTGYRKEEVVGRTTLEIGLWPNPEDRDRALDLIKKKGAIDKLPTVLRMRNGELRDFLWSTVIIEVRGQECLLSVLVDVSNLKKTEKQLAKTNKELKKRSSRLSEMNTALKVLLNQREEDKKDLESRVWHNIKKMIKPHLDNLLMTRLTPMQHAHLDVVNDRLDEIASSIGEKLGYAIYSLSTRELEVVGHIIAGKANKDIAEVLHISVHSVESHRFSIRKKLGIQGKRSNLRTHLLNLSQHVDNSDADLMKRL